MGFFSWITEDTGRSIVNAYSGLETFKVIMTDDKGNQFVEEDYEGYGEFGGKDYHELSLAHDKEKEGVKFPSLSEDGKYREGEPKSCPDQGFFYELNEELAEVEG